MTDSREPRRVAIAVAPNGGRRTKADHPAIPLTPGELARTAAECLDAGAAMIHVHVRRPDGRHLLDADAYGAAIAAIRAAVGDRLVIQITTEALGLYAPAEQVAVLKAVKPEAASLALRELAPDAAAEPAFAEALFWMKRENVLPQIILYEPAEAVRLEGMIRRGLVPWPAIPVLYVLGRYTLSQTSQPADLMPFLAPEAPRFSNWSVCAFGRHEAACVTAGALLGGHVRVGFENNLHRPDGSLAASNADLVETVATALDRLGCASCRAADLRNGFDLI
ncbi:MULTISPECIES: 3-keto-5-aminohexanoate cleavage protein [unclassified Shinella]|uniref:3-keto-5-aminohexanoate cleavage protein n=1 Tax=unclassified Shinella TaxID=2643062 RepID=UPI00225C464F|nr:MULTISPECIES: 3-keto-5-aminohexanoate cleavage protein [unclassified Shinella]MCO5137994.1 3-keto-5-aminohexanoate cleavage protein [Shinella sp.]MDC7258111.1 3-keto-5-aminohexanoate cleavage protein [Shinella sp. YE25]CAI0335134.1 putative 3-keto-5-aminohexanoate cleavage enzyme [Rhizobiaceae bacterium]CAK7259445.1 3-keto-5-aminohexanoate cleavage enzyme [Shinella sp. WSC3-e]